MKSIKFEFYFNSLQQIWNHESKLEADVRSFENLGIFDFFGKRGFVFWRAKTIWKVNKASKNGNLLKLVENKTIADMLKGNMLSQSKCNKH